MRHLWWEFGEINDKSRNAKIVSVRHLWLLQAYYRILITSFKYLYDRIVSYSMCHSDRCKQYNCLNETDMEYLSQHSDE